MKRFAVALAAMLIATAASSAAELKIICDGGAEVTVEFNTFTDGTVGWASPPRITKIACRKATEHGVPRTAYIMPGLPGEYASPQHVKDQFDMLRATLASPALIGVDPKALPTALRYAHDVLQQDKAAAARKTQAKK